MYTHLVFYDGECGLCDWAVQFILQKDRDKLFCFAPLQGETAAKLLESQYKDVDSLILVENFRFQPKMYLEGEAVVRICRELPYPWKGLSFFSIVPLCVTNGCYRWVAHHRKQWTGESCVIHPEEQERFLK